ncbi:30S ribosomal protein S4 [Candidatus Woesearchaeota archaeon]|nr:30S ribosomal protein S4 [Candidatus Woesearchaeota archaeon]
MGDPKHPKKKYSTPSHPWQKARIEEEKVLLKEYGLVNKKEIWKMNSLLKGFTQQAKQLITLTTAQADKEQKQFLKRLHRMGILSEGTQLEDVLSLKLHDVMKRRLQSQVFQRSLSRSMKQARQFITHKHIRVRDTAVTSPSYIVMRDEESLISFVPNSSLASPEHPERAIPEKKAEPKKAAPARPEERYRGERKRFRKERRREPRKPMKRKE